MIALVRRHMLDVRALAFAGMSLMTTLLTPELPPFLAVPTIGLLLLLLPREFGVFEATLPVHARTMHASRAMAVSMLALLPLVCWAVAARVQHPGEWALASVFEILLLGVIAVGVAESRWGARARQTPRPVALLAWAAAAAIWYWGYRSTPVSTRLVAELMLVLGLAAVTMRGFARMPAAMLLHASATGPSAADTSTWRDRLWTLIPGGTAAPRDGPSVRELLRMHSTMQSPVYLALWLLVTTLSGIQPSMTQPLLMMSIYLNTHQQRSAWTYLLPLRSSARLHLLLMVPLLMALGFGVVANTGSRLFIRDSDAMFLGAPYSPYEPGQYYSNPAQTPIAFWNRSPTEAPPVITAPWGETVEAETVRALGTTLYNPFTTRKANSARFVDWQFGRATERVYGRSMTKQDYDARLDGGDLPKRRTGSLRMQLLQGSLFVLVFLVMIALSLVVRQVRSRSKPTEWLLAFLPISLLLAELAVDVPATSKGTRILVPTVQRLLLSFDGVLPDATIVVALVSALPIAGLYIILRWQHAHLDAPRMVPPLQLYKR